VCGAQLERPALLEGLGFLYEGNTLVVLKLDRVARSLRQLIDTIEMLKERSIGFRSLTESIDTSMPGGRLVFRIFFALAEFERSIIREDHSRIGGGPRPRPRRRTTANDDGAGRRRRHDATGQPRDLRDEVAGCHGVSVSALYKHIPAARSAGRGEET
jgi:DNA invertase Pin-like site-specific DNA recombinase